MEQIKKTSFSLGPELFRKITERARKLGIDRHGYVRRLLELELIEWDE